MDRNTLFDCLVAWVNTFNLNVKCEGANDFKDGILIAKCLNNIDPEYFDEDWLSKIKDDTNENWRLKLLNLKKILQRITDYYSEVLNHSLSDFEMPNLNLIVETNNNTTSVEANNQLSHLLQLVLGCAVNCERKSEFIKNIMEMNESTQHMIMTAIQELMSKDRNMNLIRQSTSTLSLGGGIVGGGTMSTSASMIASTTTASGGEADIDLSYQLKRAHVEIARLGELKEDIEIKCQRLDKQVSELIEEKASLASEIDSLRSKLQRHEDGDRGDPTNEMNKQLRLQQKLDSMQEELYRLESEKEKYRIQFEAAKSEQDILLEKNIELKKVAQEHQNLRDEIDVLKHRSDRVEKLESTIESYKIKLEEMVDLKRQIKSLEENNTKYLEKILFMEEEVKKINALKSQIEMYKKQIQELHEQMLNDEMKSKKLEYEYKSLEERLNSLRAEKERLQSEYEKVKENLDKQSNNNNSNSPLNDENGQPLTMPTSEEEGSTNQLMGDLFSTAELFNIPSDIKEKLVRLCHENKVLKSKQTEYNEERYLLIQSQLEDEKQRSGDLQTRLNETSKQKIEIECQLNDLRKTSKDLLEVEQQSRNATQGDDSSRDELIGDLKTKLSRAQAQLDDECKRNEAALKSLEEKLELLSAEKNELKESREKELKAHEKEIKEMNEKYRGYLEKAKIVIKTLDPRNSTNGCSEVQFLKTQLAEKEKQIKQLTKENEKIRNSRELEERLVSSAWQKLSSTLNRRSTDERVSSVGSSSFLSQQRHLPGSSGNSNSSNSSSNNSASSVSGSPSSGGGGGISGLIHHSLSATNTPRQRSSNSFLSSLPKLNSPTPTN
uniref:Predicted protein n=1 Tax=Hordeum vulgare subsp. vulgare TaxID=112509 RepID=F2DYK5_HORVV|nr:predicted protein [Hordeum vulgare subsp. vulgare]